MNEKVDDIDLATNLKPDDIQKALNDNNIKFYETGIQHGTITAQIDNEKFELIPGSLLEVTVKYNERRSLGVPDTSVMLEGDNAYVYKVVENNNVNKIKIETGIRNKGSVEVISGLNEGDIIVAEGLKKINPKGKIKPINK